MATSHPLWQQILDFDFDKPFKPYGFSMRLMHENKWTSDFCRQAILEYKKFMFLAATVGSMVSPSEIVDVVWHQHLIFTKSYSEFCKLLGKTIQHIPSTHDREERQLFQSAKERTAESYRQYFGEQPAEIWEQTGIWDNLGFPKSRLPRKWIGGLAALAAVLLSYAASEFLTELYMQIHGLEFLIYLAATALAGYLGMFAVNQIYNRALASRLMDSPVLKGLTALEVLFLKTNSTDQMIHMEMNRLIAEGKVAVDKNNNVILGLVSPEDNQTEASVMSVVREHAGKQYKKFFFDMRNLPVFGVVRGALKPLVDNVLSSKQLAIQYTLNAILLILPLAFGGGRLILGIRNEKPIIFLAMALIALAFLAAYLLANLGKTLMKSAFPARFKVKIEQENHIATEPSWAYVFLGKSALAASMVPLLASVEPRTGSWAGGSSSSSCGSSCGGGCGGGGCGGCGS